MKPQSLFKQKQTLYTAIYKNIYFIIELASLQFSQYSCKKNASDI